MPSLSSLVSLSEHRLYWVDDRGAPVSGSKIQRFLQVNQAALTDLAGKSVAIDMADRAQTAQLLYLLDGICSRLFVVPVDIGAETLSELLSKLGVDALLSDGDMVDLEPSIETVDIQYPTLGGEKGLSNASATWASTRVDTEWIVATSGTTGVPKLVVHNLDQLSGSLKRDPSKGREYTWGLLYDLSKYAGLQVYLQALLGGSTLLLPDSQLSLGEQITYLAEHNCNALSATPTLWRKILMLPASKELQLLQVTLGGEIADQPILDALARQFPNAKIIHVYASTEAGVGFSVNDRFAGFPKAYLSECPSGALMRVVDNCLFIQSGNVSKTILDSNSYKDDEGYVDTGDLVELKDDRYYFLGRASGLINVGGNKVYPEEVEQVLLSHAKIRLARVYGKKSHLMGNLVACEMVVDDACSDSPAQIKKQARAHCAQVLPDWKVPALFKIVTNIDNSTSGKQVRK